MQQPSPPPERGEPTRPPPAKPAQHDWTDQLPDTDHVRFFKETDWPRSKLGPLQTWSPELRLFVRMLFADSRAACLWWGPEYIAIYNEAYKPLSAQAHPKLMGASFREGYPDLCAGVLPYFEQAKKTGVAADHSGSMALTVERHGWREEAFFTGNFVPIGGETRDHPDGFYNSLFEVTQQQLADRRTTMLNHMASLTDLTPPAVAKHIISSLETNPNDIPMAIMYEVVEGPEPAQLKLRGSIGLPAGHPLLVDRESLDSSKGLIPECRLAGSDMVTIDVDRRFDSVEWQGFGIPAKCVAVLAIVDGSRTLGYLIAGTNPCRPFDEHCLQFLRDLKRMTSSIVAATVSARESKERQQQLEDDLAFSDMKLRHLIEHASVGMVHASLEGDMMWANDHYYALSGSSAQEQQERMSFFDTYLDEDRHIAENAWKQLLEGAQHVNVEVRLKRLFTSPIGVAEPAQLQVLAFPYREGGKIKSIMACTTDISRLKWAETFQTRLANEAREAKRQQEAFIDVVSHEMRNPLSAIVHCADGITNCLAECHSKLAEIPKPCLDSLNDNVASANVILQCANHQKRILDDVLTLSKLDSMLLSITPSAVRPSKLINSIVSIFEAELRSNEIAHSVTPDPSLKSLEIDYLYFDPSRITQIFINLLTNAIKFIKTQKKKSITIKYGATVCKPRDLFPKEMFWAAKGKNATDVTTNLEWGNGEEVFLTFLVQDSGIGMKSKEILKIFDRFKQANMRTTVRYGGSGLGLFISKELTEKQGGEIGVSSTLGEGSTFGFYVKTRRVKRRPQTMFELAQATDNATPEQLHVLLVEDNVINQQVLGKQLKKAGCIVEVANHGLEALNLLMTKTFDIVLMDLEMPVLDGLSATQEIRRRQREGEMPGPLPIIAVTANVRQEQIDTAIAAGADRVMQKPFKAADLVHMMKGLILQPVDQFGTPETPLTPSTAASTPGIPT